MGRNCSSHPSPKRGRRCSTSATSILPTFAVICVGPRRIALGAVCGTCTPFTPVNAGCTTLSIRVRAAGPSVRSLLASRSTSHWCCSVVRLLFSTTRLVPSSASGHFRSLASRIYSRQLFRTLLQFKLHTTRADSRLLSHQLFALLSQVYTCSSVADTDFRRCPDLNKAFVW